MRPPPVLRGLVAVVLIVLTGFGPAPAASAITSDVDRSWILELEIHKNETVDVVQAIKSENGDLIRDCDVSSFEENFGIDGGIKTSAKSGKNGRSCIFTAEDMTIAQFNNNSLGSRISHEGDSFTFETGHFNDSEQVTIQVTFPGTVLEVSGYGKKFGNTAIWTTAQTEDIDIIAKGSDHAPPRDTENTDTNSSPPIIIVIVLVLAIIGGAAAFIIRQKRAKAGVAPERPRPGQPLYNPQPGYGRPAQSPGPGAVQTSHHARSGAQQPHSPQSDYDQPGQRPPGPDGQY